MNKITIVTAVIFISLFLISCKDDKEDEIMTYTNPVFEPVFADPSIIRDENGVFYAYGTQDYGEWNGEYKTSYGPIIKSYDLVNWEYTGSLFELSNRPTWGTPNAGIWAPDIVKIDNTYNLYYSLSKWGDPNPGIGVATASNPLGPWTDHGKLFDSTSIGVNNSIDATVFLDTEGRIYMIWGSFRGLYGVELTSNGLNLKDGANALNTKAHIAGLDTSTSWNGATYEAPYVIYKDGFYYMFVSSGTCCNGYDSTYNIKVGRSVSPLGPYYDDQGRSMLGTNRGYQVLSGSGYFAGPGHNAIVVDDAGDYWILYHAYDKNEPAKIGNTNRRSLMMDKLSWNIDGWPSVNALIPSNLPEDKPSIKNRRK